MSALFRVKIGKYCERGKTKYVVDLRKEKLGRKFFSVKKDAEDWAGEKERELNEHGRRALLLTDADKLELFSAKEKLKPFGVGINTAVDYFVLHHRAQIPKKVKDGIAEFLEAKRQAGCSDEYLDHMDCVLGSFSLKYGESLLHEITQAEVESWLNGNNWQPVTRKYNLKDLNTLFNFSMRRGWTKLNPCKTVEKIQVDEFSKGILTPDQAAVLLWTCDSTDPELLRYFSDQLFGGLREDESAFLTEEQCEPTLVHIRTHSIGDVVHRVKTGEERFNEINDTWKRWRRGKYAPIVNLRKRSDAVKQYAKAEMVELGLAKSDWWYPANCLRHSFCTYFAAAIGAEKTARLAGHSEKTQKRHYRRPVPMEVAESYLEI